MEDKYCRCVMKVSSSSPKYNPYAVCSSRIKRTKVIHCDVRYNFTDYTTEQLRGYARLKKLPASNASRQALIRMLNAHVRGSKKSKNNTSRRSVVQKGAASIGKWQAHLRKYRAAHPNVPYREALKKASTSYRRR